jgi:hypothetical protein
MANKNKQKKENEKPAFCGTNFPLFQILLLCKTKFWIPMVNLPPPPSVVSQVTLMQMILAELQLFIKPFTNLFSLQEIDIMSQDSQYRATIHCPKLVQTNPVIPRPIFIRYILLLYSHLFQYLHPECSIISSSFQAWCFSCPIPPHLIVEALKLLLNLHNAFFNSVIFISQILSV